jgi:hypothetical protein
LFSRVFSFFSSLCAHCVTCHLRRHPCVHFCVSVLTGETLTPEEQREKAKQDMLDEMKRQKQIIAEGRVCLLLFALFLNDMFLPTVSVRMRP